MEDRRKAARQRLISLTVVIDTHSGEVLGRIGNLTTDGLMLCSDRAIEIGRTLSIEIKLPDAIRGRKELHLEARSLWSQRAVDPTYFATGFEILRIEKEDRRVVELLVDDAVFQRIVG